MSTQPKAYPPHISKWRQKARGYAAGKFDTFIFNENYYAVYSGANGTSAVAEVKHKGGIYFNSYA